MMRKMKMTCVCAMAFLFGFLGSLQAFAAPQENEQVKENEVHGRDHFRHNPEFIKKQADSLGIKTEGKDTDTIVKEVREAMIKKRAEELRIDTKGKDLDSLAKEVRETEIKTEAKELGISTEGKHLRDVVHEIRETQIKKEAKELGISTDNKDLREVAHAVREKRIFQAAEKLGIESKNKSANELFKEIMTNHADKVKELNLFPHREGKLFFFDRSKEN
ncbi:hypothetical protein [Bacillus sp. X1(2014)]|uniref:hypothetical protein n=1 Tax=Bacillus sp. X1(2014) TaxID=1565991 RepID=UPI00119ED894|nr:hypothetical protein [Bacillus sp. X1(2014)]